MIRITCPNCASKLNAKDELVGQVRKCPKCGCPVTIVAEVSDDELLAAFNELLPGNTGTTEPATGIDVSAPLAKPDLPKRLERDSHYIICDRTRLLAAWENNGQGWRFKTGSGMVNARRNADKIPAEGDFRLVELRLEVTPEGRRLIGLRIYQLAQRWALMAIAQDDDSIVEKIASFGSLNRDQKFVVRTALKDHFMRPVWENSAKILEFLGNTDFHSHEIA